MIRTITRRLFDTGNSRTFALPLDWPSRNEDRVFVIYDDFLLIIPEAIANQIDIQQFISLLKNSLLQERAPHDSPENEPPR